MLKNTNIETLNPSKSQIIHKNTYYTITKYVHMNGKVCAHTNTLFYDGISYTFSVIPATFYYKNVKSQRNNMVNFVKSQRNNSIKMTSTENGCHFF